MAALAKRFAYLIFAGAIVFLIYLVSSNTHRFDQPKRSAKESKVLEALRTENQNEPTQGGLPAFPRNPQHNGPPLVPPRDPETERGDTELKFQRDPPKVTTSTTTTTTTSTTQAPRSKSKAEQAEAPIKDPYSGPQNEKQKAVVNAFMHAWNAYKKYAWGHDEFRPLSKSWQEWFGVGLTIIDSMDTMYIMGLKDEFKLSRDWVAANLTFTSNREIQLFEVVIRALGGLLSAYHLSGDDVFMDKALDLGTRLLPCLDGPQKIPCNRINFSSRRPNFIEISTAETGTIQLEFNDLAKITGQPQFKILMDQINEKLHSMEKMDGLAPCFISATSGTFRKSSAVSFGASADSYYEYLLKQWIQSGKKQDWMKNDYLEAIVGMKKHLVRTTHPSKLTFVGSLSSMNSRRFRADMEHLTCFIPGTLALGYMHGLDKDHLELAKQIGQTCYEMYRRMPTGLSPEVASMNMMTGLNEDIRVNYGDQFNIQRPETVESLFYLYRATKDEKYREWAWNIFQAFEKYTKLKEGYTSIDNVKTPNNLGYRDKMETFYLAETLKYLYLLFSDDPNLMPLDKFVFNTEAHPLPVYNS